MTSAGGRRDQRRIGYLLIAAAAVWAFLATTVFPLTYSCPAGSPCPPPAFGLEALLAVPVLGIGLGVIVVGHLPSGDPAVD